MVEDGAAPGGNRGRSGGSGRSSEEQGPCGRNAPSCALESRICAGDLDASNSGAVDVPRRAERVATRVSHISHHAPPAGSISHSGSSCIVGHCRHKLAGGGSAGALMARVWLRLGGLLRALSSIGGRSSGRAWPARSPQRVPWTLTWSGASGANLFGEADLGGPEPVWPARPNPRDPAQNYGTPHRHT